VKAKLIEKALKSAGQSFVIDEMIQTLNRKHSDLSYNFILK